MELFRNPLLQHLAVAITVYTYDSLALLHQCTKQWILVLPHLTDNAKKGKEFGTGSLKPLKLTDRSDTVRDSAIYTTRENDDVVVLICGVTDGSILSGEEENKGGSDGYVIAVNATGISWDIIPQVA